MLGEVEWKDYIGYCISDTFIEGIHIFHFCRILVSSREFSEWNDLGQVYYLGSVSFLNMMGEECLDWPFQNVSIWPHVDTHNKNKSWPRTTLQLVQIL